MQKRSVAPYHYANPVGVCHNVYIYDDVGGADNYVDVIEALDNAVEQDVFNIKVATGGGDLDGCIALVHAIRRTKAQVIGHAESIVASAGTIIFLSCHNWVINEFAYFLFHDGSTATVGKFNENRKMMDAITKLYNNIAEKVYKPFFSQEEIDKIMDGSDLYLTAEEMAARIDAVYPAAAELQEDDSDDES